VILVSTSTEEYAGAYVEALKAVGVPAGEIHVVGPTDEIPGEVIREARGLLLCGGVDVEPGRYDEETIPSASVETLPERDAQEWRLLDAAREARMPVWGVCRGLQVLNVYLGGSLWQDLPSQRPSPVEHSIEEPKDHLAHPVRVIDPAAPIAERLTGKAPLVNSRHHQAVKRLAPGLAVVAESPDGLVEAAILDDAGWWVRGVQWHPENLVALPEQRALWTDFARAAGVLAPASL
jgi:putative glutamine amidotransferase